MGRLNCFPKRYNEEIKGIKEVDHISADMAIPEEAMK
jgi:hypothetical protein